MVRGWWWTLLTAMYLHGSLLHIVFNMMWIRNLGPAAAEVYGPGRAFLLFNFAGASGFLVSNLMSGTPTIGASGSIFGLLARPDRLRPPPAAARSSPSSSGSGPSSSGCSGSSCPASTTGRTAGGSRPGWIGAYLMSLDDDRQDSSWVILASLALIVVTVVGFGLSLVQVTGELLG